MDNLSFLSELAVGASGPPRSSGEGPKRPAPGSRPADLPADRLVDSFGRAVRKLRISVTDRCNFRCVYCMPEGDIPWIPKDEILTYEEMARVAAVAARFGVDSIRLTGGEPLVRRDLPDLVRLLKEIPGVRRIGMTTNAYYLPDLAEALKEAGLGSLNISLDTLDREKFFRMTRRDYFHQVMAGIEAAQAAGFPIKINAVVMRGYNDDEIPAFLRWSRERGLQVRFIEFMPLNGDGHWSLDLVVPVDELLEKARQVAPFRPKNNDPSAPAREFVFEDGGEFGIIPTISRPFCGHCDRIRLTADGKIRNCLFAVDEFDLRSLLRGGATDEELAEALRDAVWAKWEGHTIHEARFIKPERAMYAIGG